MCFVLKNVTGYEKVAFLCCLVIALGLVGYLHSEQNGSGAWIVERGGVEEMPAMATAEIEDMMDSSPIVKARDLIAEPISINEATLEELVLLPNIGETRGNAIIAYREEVGAFQSLEELMEVSGIGMGIFTGLEEYIVLENP